MTTKRIQDGSLSVWPTRGTVNTLRSVLGLEPNLDKPPAGGEGLCKVVLLSDNLEGVFTTLNELNCRPTRENAPYIHSCIDVEELLTMGLRTSRDDHPSNMAARILQVAIAAASQGYENVTPLINTRYMLVALDAQCNGLEICVTAAVFDVKPGLNAPGRSGCEWMSEVVTHAFTLGPTHTTHVRDDGNSEPQFSWFCDSVDNFVKTVGSILDIDYGLTTHMTDMRPHNTTAYTKDIIPKGYEGAVSRRSVEQNSPALYIEAPGLASAATFAAHQATDGSLPSEIGLSNYENILSIVCTQSISGKAGENGMGCKKAHCLAPVHLCSVWWRNVKHPEDNPPCTSTYSPHLPKGDGPWFCAHVRPTCPDVQKRFAKPNVDLADISCSRGQRCYFGHDSLELRYKIYQRMYDEGVLNKALEDVLVKNSPKQATTLDERRLAFANLEAYTHQKLSQRNMRFYQLPRVDDGRKTGPNNRGSKEDVTKGRVAGGEGRKKR